MLRSCWEIARLSFRRRLTYRTATLAGILTNLCFGFLRVCVFRAVLDARGGAGIAGYDLPRLVTYTALTQGLIAFIMIFGWYDLMQTIGTGAVGADLCRPIGLYRFWQCRDLGRALHDLLFRGLPVFLAYAFFTRLVLPRGTVAWLLCALSLALAVLISFAWRFLLNCLAFWTVDARGLAQIGYMAATFLTGFIVPVSFFPPWLRGAVALTPLPSMVDLPVSFFLGRYTTGGQIARALVTQACWLGVMAWAASTTARVGVRHLSVQGG